MVKPMPRWLMIRYSVLYREFKTGEFTRDKAKESLNKYSLNEDEKLTNVFFSELADLGWISFKQDASDKRKKIYKLISPENAILTLEIKEVDEK